MSLGVKIDPNLRVTSWNKRNKECRICRENDSGEQCRAIMALLSQNVFHSYIFIVHQNVALCGNGLNEFVKTIKMTLFQASKSAIDINFKFGLYPSFWFCFP